METKQVLKERTKNWWYCDNIVTHRGQIGLLHMDFPQVFILIRDEKDAYFATFEEFKNKIAEVNFFDSTDREKTNIEELLTDAWNFMALQEEIEEEIYKEITDDTD